MNLILLTLYVAVITHITPTRDPHKSVYNIIVQEDSVTFVWGKTYAEPEWRKVGDTLYLNKTYK